MLQKRFDGSVRFSNRTWVEYQNGFGKVSGEYWLGLDRIHRLAKNPVTLRFDLGAPDGRTRFAVYQGFTVAGADQKYLMTSGTYTGKSSFHNLAVTLLTVFLASTIGERSSFSSSYTGLASRKLCCSLEPVCSIFFTDLFAFFI